MYNIFHKERYAGPALNFIYMYLKRYFEILKWSNGTKLNFIEISKRFRRLLLSLGLN